MVQADSGESTVSGGEDSKAVGCCQEKNKTKQNITLLELLWRTQLKLS